MRSLFLGAFLLLPVLFVVHAPGTRPQGARPQSAPTDALGLTKELRGTLYAGRAHRLALYWENGDFELWDTSAARRLGEVHHLPRRLAWCLASPNEATIVTADAMPNIEKRDELDAQLSGLTVETLR